MTRVAAFAVLVAASCKIEPEVGRLERTCEAETQYERPAGFDGAGPDPRCSSTGPTVENDCDRCENENCCITRFACYDDTVCRCADQAFDECLDDAARQDAASFEAAADQCAADFASSGQVARARLECRESACSTECKASRP
jgi:hypothetical protein